LAIFIKSLKKWWEILTICGFSAVVFQSGKKGLIRFLLPLTHDMAVQTFFLLRADLEPHMDTLLVSLQVAAEKPAVAIPFKHCSARLTGDAVVVALSSEMLAIAHLRNRLYQKRVRECPHKVTPLPEEYSHALKNMADPLFFVCPADQHTLVYANENVTAC
jgi:hypothetical protein